MESVKLSGWILKSSHQYRSFLCNVCCIGPYVWNLCQAACLRWVCGNESCRPKQYKNQRPGRTMAKDKISAAVLRLLDDTAYTPPLLHCLADHKSCRKSVVYEKCSSHFSATYAEFYSRRWISSQCALATCRMSCIVRFTLNEYSVSSSQDVPRE